MFGRFVIVGTLVAAALAGCTYRGGGDPVTRNLTWFSYLNGDDLRAACLADAPDRYRFVYNGVYVEQVRTYDVTANGADGRHLLNVRVLGPADFGEITITEPPDILAPWRGKAETVVLRDEDLRTLKRAMDASGVFAGAPAGLQLHSEDFYWTVAACADGRFGFNAYRWPSERFEKAAFAPLLFAWDFSGVAVNPPRTVDPFDLFGEPEGEELNKRVRFNLVVDENGLFGLPRLF